MDTILFIPYHLESHILPTLVLAQVLKEKYRVVYALPNKFKWLADAHNLEYCNLESVPFAYGFESVMRKQEGKKHIWRSALRDRRNVRISKHREKKLKEVTDVIKPRFIILDMLSSTDFILLYPYLKNNNAGAAILNPMLSTYTNSSVPRIGSSLNPVNRFSTIAENVLVRIMYNVFNTKEYVKWLGNDNRSLIKRELKRKEVPQKHKLVPGNYVANFFNEIPELIIAPQELEFFNEYKKKNQHYIGLLPDSKRAGEKNNPQLDEIAEKIASWRKNKNTRIIFCAFGSMHQTANPAIAGFLQRLFAVTSSDYDLKIICAFNDTANLIGKQALSPHICLYNRLPQPQLIPLCDLFITHAGLGSVKEAITSGVPMLAYPFTKDWDSTGNAVKIEYHGLGLRGDILKDSRATIAERINSIFMMPVYKENILRLRENIEKKYTIESFLSLFETLIEKKIQ